MIRKQLFDSESSTFTYLLGDENSRLAAIIDPVISNVREYLAVLDQLDLRLHTAIDTHTHADHITAQSLLREVTGCRMLVSRESRTSCHCPIFDGSRMLHVGDLRLMPIHTPGHTVDSYSFYFVDDGQPVLLTGDTLLIRGTGRTDFQGGSAAQQYDSIFGALLRFPDDTLVFPGHDYHGRRVSTIGDERALNPRLQVPGKAAYIELMNGLTLPPPRMIRQALAANRTCGRVRESGSAERRLRIIDEPASPGTELLVKATHE